jgi:uncharacterized protein (TIGR02449 family)
MQNLDKLDLGGLEYQVDSLLRNIHQLRFENSTLRSKLKQAEQQIEQLDEKHNIAATKLDKIITQLKEEMA